MAFTHRSLQRLIFSALSSANAVIVVGACSGKAISDGGSAGHPSTDGMITGAAGGTAGTADSSVDESRPGGSGGQSGGSGGADGGRGPIGGTAGAGGILQGVGGYNCANSGVGTCCDYNECYTPSELDLYLSQHPDAMVRGTGGAADAGQGGEPATCPEIQRNWLCGYFHEGVTQRDGKCCYVVNTGGCCGRPFIVAGSPRQSEVWSGAGWLARSAASSVDAALSSAEAEELAGAWAADALLEHASVAAFARFALELMSMGAPAELVQAAQQASLDEIVHASACFGLASRFAGDELGPGPLSMSGLELAQDLVELALTVFREGCIGETLAAALAHAQLSFVVDASCRQVLEMVARDEAQHAALAWRAVRHALEQGGLPVARALRRALDSFLPASMLPREPRTAVAVWNHYGRLTRPQAEVAIAQAWRELIVPAIALLLEPFETPEPGTGIPDPLGTSRPDVKLSRLSLTALQQASRSPVRYSPPPALTKLRSLV